MRINNKYKRRQLASIAGRAGGVILFLCIMGNGTAVRAQPVTPAPVPESFRMTRKLEPGRTEALEMPDETYWDRDGNQYVLDHWEINEIPGHMAKRNLEKELVYTGVEGAEGLPESISVKEELSGIPGQGELYMRDSRIVREEWQDGFSAPVLFHSYGADEYQAGSLVISGEDILSSAVDEQKVLLEIMGLSSEEYRILAMQWDGEPFEDGEGQTCRQAIAKGQKLTRDIAITYEGEVEFMEPVSYEMEMVYRPIQPSGIWVEEEEVIPPRPIPVPAASESREEGALWYWVQSGFVITVGAGLIGICAGIMILAGSWLRQKKRERQKRYLPKIRG